MTTLGQDLLGAPIGSIIVWTKLIASIPDGWQTCDGTNGTPDLRDRFIKEVPNAGTNPGATGGTTEETIDISKMPAHSHLSTSTSSTHNHGVEVAQSSGGGSNIYKGGSGGLPEVMPDASLEKVADPIQFQGGDQPHTNMPAFFEVIFIQRLT
ncbi:MAG: hypothetical protein V3V41_02060 [Candidatus Heimdallarchaeota archaeon]